MEVHRWFCGRCGVTVAAGGSYVMPAAAAGDTSGGDGEGDGKAAEEGAGKGETVHFFAISAVTLDQPQQGLDLSEFKVAYFDGRNDNWMAGKKDVPWAGGIV